MRLRDWQSRLDATIAAHRAMPFAWGAHDCALFAADCVQAVTGTDPAADLRGKYRTEAGAARHIKRLGGMEAIADARLGARVPVLMAQVGDVALIGADAPHFAVCAGQHWLAAALDGGLAVLPLRDARICWRVA